MEYELSAEVIKILDDLAERFGIAIDWASENVMPYLIELYNRFIIYKITVNCIPVTLFVISILILIVFIIKYFKYKNIALETKQNNLFIYVKFNNDCVSSDFSNSFLITLSIICAVLGVFSILAILNLLKLIFVPEIYMIEYLTHYM